MPDRPLVVTADPALLDDLLRLAAAAGAEVEVAHDMTAARGSWPGAPLVVLGDDLAAAAARAEPPRRPGVVLVGVDLDDARVWQRAVAVGAETVVFLPDAEKWLVDRLGDSVDGGRGHALSVAVVGGRGGSGATTLAAALAVTAARLHLRCLLVDGDPLGGGIDLVLGGEDASGLRWPDLAATGGRVSGTALRAALPTVGRSGALTVLSWDRGDALTVPADAMRSVLAAARRTNDLVVVDLPRRVDEAAETALAAADLTLLVVPAEVRATAAAARVAVAVGLVAANVRVVVRGPAPAGLTGPLVAEALGLPLAGWLRAEPGLAESLERGRPPARDGKGPLAAFSAELLRDLGVLDRPAA
ncbi:MAG TPA: septum site-determining protein Ssd [Actinomycetes bacterium]